MAATTQWGTRKALGSRFKDPAYQYELARLGEEYALQPARDARSMQASQFAQNLDMQQSANKQAGLSGLVGTVGNLATTGMMMNAYKGKPLLSNPFSSTTPAPTSAAPSGPATIDTTATGLGAGGVGGYTAAQASALPANAEAAPILADMGANTASNSAIASGSGSGFSASSVAGPIAIIGGALAAKSQWGGKDIPWDEKTYMQKSATAPGSILGAGGVLTNFAGNDTAVGKFGKEAARIEQQAMQPIEAVFNWVGSWF